MISPPERSALVIDNFTLQDVGGTLTHGLSHDHRAEIGRSTKKAGYVVRSIPAAGIQVEALLQLLNVIVLQEELIVDAAFLNAWKDADMFLGPLRAGLVVVAKPFHEARAEWLPRREFAEEVLCFTPQLARDFGRYKAAYPNVEPNAAMSTLVWGTAGMLARSHFLDSPYLGHPSRARLIECTSFSATSPSAAAIVTDYIVTERTKFFERAIPGSLERFASLRVPPIAFEVIAEARDSSQLIVVALQLREKYKKLRNWIGDYQRALKEGPESAAKYKGVLEAATKDLEASFKPSWWSDLSLSLSFGVSLPRLTKTVPVESMLHRYMPWSIRSALIRTIKRTWDEKTLEKLFTLLEADNPKIQAIVLAHLRGT
jgi:hypothetical protein